MFTAVVFLFSSIAAPFAQAQTSRPATPVAGDAQRFLRDGSDLPHDAGTVVETRWLDGGPFVYHLQDAHGLAPAQWNAARILKTLLPPADGGAAEPLLVLVEGAAGPVDTDWISGFPNAKARERAAARFLSAGKMTGEEYAAAVEAPGRIRLEGIEDAEIYRRHVAAREGGARARRALAGPLAEARRRLDGAKEKVYPAALLEADRLERAFEEKRISLRDYLNGVRRRLPASFPWRDYPEMGLAFQIAEREARLDRLEVDAERQLLLGRMLERVPAEEVARWVALTVDARLGRVSPAEYARRLVDLSERLRLEAPHLRLYAEVADLQQRLRQDALAEEMSAFSRTVRRDLAGTDAARRLVRVCEWGDLQSKFWFLSMSPGEARRYESESAGLDWGRALDELERLAPGTRTADLRAWLAPAPEFAAWKKSTEAYYRLAFRRDEVLAANALRAIERAGAKRAVLIAGGFHTEGVARLLRDRGVSYAVVRPFLSAPSLRAPSEDKTYALFQRRLAEVAGALRDASLLGRADFQREVSSRLLTEALVAEDGPALEAFERLRAGWAAAYPDQAEAIEDVNLVPVVLLRGGRRYAAGAIEGEGGSLPFLMTLSEEGTLEVAASGEDELRAWVREAALENEAAETEEIAERLPDVWRFLLPVDLEPLTGGGRVAPLAVPGRVFREGAREAGEEIGRLFEAGEAGAAARVALTASLVRWLENPAMGLAKTLVRRVAEESAAALPAREFVEEYEETVSIEASSPAGKQFEEIMRGLNWRNPGPGGLLLRSGDLSLWTDPERPLLLHVGAERGGARVTLAVVRPVMQEGKFFYELRRVAPRGVLAAFLHQAFLARPIAQVIENAFSLSPDFVSIDEAEKFADRLGRFFQASVRIRRVGQGASTGAVVHEDADAYYVACAKHSLFQHEGRLAERGLPVVFHDGTTAPARVLNFGDAYHVVPTGPDPLDIPGDVAVLRVEKSSLPDGFRVTPVVLEPAGWSGAAVETKSRAFSVGYSHDGRFADARWGRFEGIRTIANSTDRQVLVSGMRASGGNSGAMLVDWATGRVNGTLTGRRDASGLSYFAPADQIIETLRRFVPGYVPAPPFSAETVKDGDSFDPETLPDGRVKDFLRHLDRANRRLELEGYDAQWFLVGGAVRRLLLGNQQEVPDLDVALKMSAPQTPQAEALQDGTVRRAKEILRRELGLEDQPDGVVNLGKWRGLDVEFPGPILDDARMKGYDDPSFNMVFIGGSGAVIDKRGGLADFRAGVVRWVPAYGNQKPGLYAIARGLLFKHSLGFSYDASTAEAFRGALARGAKELLAAEEKPSAIAKILREGFVQARDQAAYLAEAKALGLREVFEALGLDFAAAERSVGKGGRGFSRRTFLGSFAMALGFQLIPSGVKQAFAQAATALKAALTPEGEKFMATVYVPQLGGINIGAVTKIFVWDFGLDYIVRTGRPMRPADFPIYVNKDGTVRMKKRGGFIAVDPAGMALGSRVRMWHADMGYFAEFLEEDFPATAVEGFKAAFGAAAEGVRAETNAALLAAMGASAAEFSALDEAAARAKLTLGLNALLRGGAIWPLVHGVFSEGDADHPGPGTLAPLRNSKGEFLISSKTAALLRKSARVKTTVKGRNGKPRTVWTTVSAAKKPEEFTALDRFGLTRAFLQAVYPEETAGSREVEAWAMDSGGAIKDDRIKRAGQYIRRMDVSIWFEDPKQKNDWGRYQFPGTMIVREIIPPENPEEFDRPPLWQIVNAAFEEKGYRVVPVEQYAETAAGGLSLSVPVREAALKAFGSEAKVHVVTGRHRDGYEPKRSGMKTLSYDFDAEDFTAETLAHVAGRLAQTAGPDAREAAAVRGYLAQRNIRPEELLALDYGKAVANVVRALNRALQDDDLYRAVDANSPSLTAETKRLVAAHKGGKGKFSREEFQIVNRAALQDIFFPAGHRPEAKKGRLDVFLVESKWLALAKTKRDAASAEAAVASKLPGAAVLTTFKVPPRWRATAWTALGAGAALAALAIPWLGVWAPAAALLSTPFALGHLYHYALARSGLGDPAPSLESLQKSLEDDPFLKSSTGARRIFVHPTLHPVTKALLWNEPANGTLHLSRSFALSLSGSRFLRAIARVYLRHERQELLRPGEARAILAEFRTANPLEWLIALGSVPVLVEELFARVRWLLGGVARAPVKAFLVDIGNVLVSVDPGRMHAALAAHTDMTAEEFAAKFEGSELSRDYRLGRMNEEDFYAALQERFGFRGTRRDFRAAFNGVFGERVPGMTEFLRRARREGFRIVLVSDTNPTHFRHFEKEYADLLALADAAVLSHLAGKDKADEEIFDAALERAGVPAASAVFIDDSPGNAAVARRRGIRAAEFGRFGEFWTWLRAAAEKRGDRRLRRLATKAGRDVPDRLKDVRPAHPLPGVNYVITDADLALNNRLPLPKARRVLVVEASSGEAAYYAGNLLRRLAETADISYVAAGDARALRRALRRGADLVLAPYGDAETKRVVAGEARARRSPVTLFGYETPGPAGNLVWNYAEEDHAAVLRGVAAHKSQMRRTPFDRLTDDVARANGLRSGAGGFANVFETAFVEEGEETAATETLDKGDVGLSREVPLLVVSPHADDFEIALGGLARDHLRKLPQGRLGALNWVFTRGWNGVPDKDEDFLAAAAARLGVSVAEAAKIDLEKALGAEEVRTIKARLRERELAAAAQAFNAGVPGRMASEALALDVSPQEAAHRLRLMLERFISAHEAALSSGERLTVVLPHPEDAHPTHRWSTELMRREIKKLSAEKGISVRLLYYKSPWAGTYNGYFLSGRNVRPEGSAGDAAEADKRALGYVVGELTAGFGKPSTPAAALGGEFAERFHVDTADEYGIWDLETRFSAPRRLPIRRAVRAALISAFLAIPFQQGYRLAAGYLRGLAGSVLTFRIRDDYEARVALHRNYEEMSRAAARLIADRIREKPDLVLGLATGSTPVGVYKELRRLHEAEGLDFSRVRIFHLDEYLGLPGDHDQSYQFFLRDNLLDHVNVKEENLHFLNGLAKDAAAEAARYEDAIRRAGGIDIQILGIGSNGHIAFNEPGTAGDSRTGKVDLAESTVLDNARFFVKETAAAMGVTLPADRPDFNDLLAKAWTDARALAPFFRDDAQAAEFLEKIRARVPVSALSQGIGTILEAKELILLANGKNKAAPIAKSLRGFVSRRVPASFLQNHRRVWVYLDPAAAEKIEPQEPLWRRVFDYVALEYARQRLEKERFSIGVSVGGTKVAVAAVTESGGVLFERYVNWRTELGADASREELIGLISTLIAQVMRESGSDRAGEIGIAWAGPGRYDDGIVWGANMSGFRWDELSDEERAAGGAPLGEALGRTIERQFGRAVPIRLTGDAGAATLLEYGPFGTFPDESSGMGVIWGTGIGAGYVIDNKPFYGGPEVAGRMGSVGHHLVWNGTGYDYYAHETKGEIDFSRSENFLEKRLAGPAIAVRFAEYLLARPSLAGRIDDLDALAEKARERDDAAARTLLEFLNRWHRDPDFRPFIEEVGYEMGRGLGAFAAHYRGEDFVRRIVLMGGISDNLARPDIAADRDLLLEAVQVGMEDALKEAGLGDEEARSLARGVARSRGGGYRKEMIAFAPPPKDRRVSAEAIAASDKFMESRAQYALGRLHTEKLGKLDISGAVKRPNGSLRVLEMLAREEESVSRALRAAESSLEPVVRAMAEALANDGHVVFIGAGSMLRQSIFLEREWRAFVASLPDEVAQALPGDLAERVIGLGAGGDAAQIRSVENMEDNGAVGEAEMRRLLRRLKRRGTGPVVVVGHTASGTSRYVLNALKSAAAREATAVFVFNNPAEELSSVERAREVLEDPRILKVELPTGPPPMAGSTRLQPTTAGMAALGAALGDAAARAFSVLQRRSPRGLLSLRQLVRGIFRRPEHLRPALRGLAAFVDLKAAVYGRNESFWGKTPRKDAGYVTFLSGRRAFHSVLSNDVEENPTFGTPPYATAKEIAGGAVLSPSGALVEADGAEAGHEALFGRPVRGLDLSELLQESDLERLFGKGKTPDLSAARVLAYRFDGAAAWDVRPTGEGNLVAVVLLGEDVDEFLVPDSPLRRRLEDARARGARTAIIAVTDRPVADAAWPAVDALASLHVPADGLSVEPSVALKTLLNLQSVAAMAKMNKIYGSLMFDLSPSNGKLVDRATRYILHALRSRYGRAADYRTANRYLFDAMQYTAAYRERGLPAPSPVKVAFLRLAFGYTTAEAAHRLKKARGDLEGVASKSEAEWLVRNLQRPFWTSAGFAARFVRRWGFSNAFGARELPALSALGARAARWVKEVISAARRLRRERRRPEESRPSRWRRPVGQRQYPQILETTAAVFGEDRVDAVFARIERVNALSDEARAKAGLDFQAALFALSQISSNAMLPVKVRRDLLDALLASDGADSFAAWAEKDLRPALLAHLNAWGLSLSDGISTEDLLIRALLGVTFRDRYYVPSAAEADRVRRILDRQKASEGPFGRFLLGLAYAEFLRFLPADYLDEIPEGLLDRHDAGDRRSLSQMWAGGQFNAPTKSKGVHLAGSVFAISSELSHLYDWMIRRRAGKPFYMEPHVTASGDYVREYEGYNGEIFDRMGVLMSKKSPAWLTFDRAGLLAEAALAVADEAMARPDAFERYAESVRKVVTRRNDRVHARGDDVWEPGFAKRLTVSERYFLGREIAESAKDRSLASVRAYESLLAELAAGGVSGEELARERDQSLGVFALQSRGTPLLGDDVMFGYDYYVVGVHDFAERIGAEFSIHMALAMRRAGVPARLQPYVYAKAIEFIDRELPEVSRLPDKIEPYEPIVKAIARVDEAAVRGWVAELAAEGVAAEGEPLSGIEQPSVESVFGGFRRIAPLAKSAANAAATAIAWAGALAAGAVLLTGSSWGLLGLTVGLPHAAQAAMIALATHEALPDRGLIPEWQSASAILPYQPKNPARPSLADRVHLLADRYRIAQTQGGRLAVRREAMRRLPHGVQRWILRHELNHIRFQRKHPRTSAHLLGRLLEEFWVSTRDFAGLFGLRAARGETVKRWLERHPAIGRPSTPGAGFGQTGLENPEVAEWLLSAAVSPDLLQEARAILGRSPDVWDFQSLQSLLELLQDPRIDDNFIELVKQLARVPGLSELVRNIDLSVFDLRGEVAGDERTRRALRSFTRAFDIITAAAALENRGWRVTALSRPLVYEDAAGRASALTLDAVVEDAADSARRTVMMLPLAAAEKSDGESRGVQEALGGQRLEALAEAFEGRILSGGDDLGDLSRLEVLIPASRSSGPAAVKSRGRLRVRIEPLASWPYFHPQGRGIHARRPYATLDVNDLRRRMNRLRLSHGVGRGVRAVVSDIDQTLAAHGEAITPENAEYLRRLLALGVPVAFITGKSNLDFIMDAQVGDFVASLTSRQRSMLRLYTASGSRMFGFDAAGQPELRWQHPVLRDPKVRDRVKGAVADVFRRTVKAFAIENAQHKPFADGDVLDPGERRKKDLIPMAMFVESELRRHPELLDAGVEMSVTIGGNRDIGVDPSGKGAAISHVMAEFGAPADQIFYMGDSFFNYGNDNAVRRQHRDVNYAHVSDPMETAGYLQTLVEAASRGRFSARPGDYAVRRRTTAAAALLAALLVAAGPVGVGFVFGGATVVWSSPALAALSVLLLGGAFVHGGVWLVASYLLRRGDGGPADPDMEQLVRAWVEEYAPVPVETVYLDGDAMDRRYGAGALIGSDPADRKLHLRRGWIAATRNPWFNVARRGVLSLLLRYRLESHIRPFAAGAYFFRLPATALRLVGETMRLEYAMSLKAFSPSLWARRELYERVTDVSQMEEGDIADNFLGKLEYDLEEWRAGRAPRPVVYVRNTGGGGDVLNNIYLAEKYKAMGAEVVLVSIFQKYAGLNTPADRTVHVPSKSEDPIWKWDAAAGRYVYDENAGYGRGLEDAEFADAVNAHVFRPTARTAIKGADAAITEAKLVGFMDENYRDDASPENRNLPARYRGNFFMIASKDSPIAVAEAEYDFIEKRCALYDESGRAVGARPFYVVVTGTGGDFISNEYHLKASPVNEEYHMLVLRQMLKSFGRSPALRRASGRTSRAAQASLLWRSIVFQESSPGADVESTPAGMQKQLDELYQARILTGVMMPWENAAGVRKMQEAVALGVSSKANMRFVKKVESVPAKFAGFARFAESLRRLLPARLQRALRAAPLPGYFTLRGRLFTESTYKRDDTYNMMDMVFEVAGGGPTQDSFYFHWTRMRQWVVENTQLPPPEVSKYKPFRELAVYIEQWQRSTREGIKPTEAEELILEKFRAARSGTDGALLLNMVAGERLEFPAEEAFRLLREFEPLVRRLIETSIDLKLQVIGRDGTETDQVRTLILLAAQHFLDRADLPNEVTRGAGTLLKNNPLRNPSYSLYIFPRPDRVTHVDNAVAFAKHVYQWRDARALDVRLQSAESPSDVMFETFDYLMNPHGNAYIGRNVQFDLFDIAHRAFRELWWAYRRLPKDRRPQAAAAMRELRRIVDRRDERRPLDLEKTPFAEALHRLVQRYEKTEIHRHISGSLSPMLLMVLYWRNPAARRQFLREVLSRERPLHSETAALPPAAREPDLMEPFVDLAFAGSFGGPASAESQRALARWLGTLTHKEIDLNDPAFVEKFASFFGSRGALEEELGKAKRFIEYRPQQKRGTLKEYVEYLATGEIVLRNDPVANRVAFRESILEEFHRDNVTLMELQVSGIRPATSDGTSGPTQGTLEEVARNYMEAFDEVSELSGGHAKASAIIVARKEPGAVLTPARMAAAEEQARSAAESARAEGRPLLAAVLAGVRARTFAGLTEEEAAEETRWWDDFIEQLEFHRVSRGLDEEQAALLVLRLEATREEQLRRVRDVADLKRRWRVENPRWAARLIGVGSVGSEEDFFPWTILPAMRLARRSDLRNSIHVGEAWAKGEERMALLRLRQVVASGYLDRLEHGTILGVLPRDFSAKLPFEEIWKIRQLQRDLLVRVARERIPVVSMPTSNVELSVFGDYGAHLLQFFYKQALKVAVAQDNSWIFHTRGSPGERVKFWLAHPNMKFIDWLAIEQNGFDNAMTPNRLQGLAPIVEWVNRGEPPAESAPRGPPEVNGRSFRRLAGLLAAFRAGLRLLARAASRLGASSAGAARVPGSIGEAVRAFYAGGGVDAFLPPAVLLDGSGAAAGRIEPGDVVISFNARRDGLRQLLAALSAPAENGLVPFARRASGLKVFAPTRTPGVPGLTEIHPPEAEARTLAAAAAAGGARPALVAADKDFDRVMGPFLGHEKPALPIERRRVGGGHSRDVTAETAAALRRGRLVVAHYGAAARSAEQGDLAGAVSGAEEIDREIGALMAEAAEQDAVLIVVSDRGLAESVPAPGALPGSASTNPVPFHYYDSSLPAARDVLSGKPGRLAGVAPTVLELLGLEAPASMGGGLFGADARPEGGRKVIVAVIEGRGAGDAADPRNAWTQARTPYLTSLAENHPMVLLAAHGADVGLAPGEPSDAETGFFNLGAGRSPKDAFARAAERIENEALLKALRAAKAAGRRVHLVGLLSARRAHASKEAAKRLLELLKREGLEEVFLHGILDGIEGPARDASAQWAAWGRLLEEAGVGRLATLMGRRFAMDAAGDWKKTKTAYDGLVGTAGPDGAGGETPEGGAPDGPALGGAPGVRSAPVPGGLLPHPTLKWSQNSVELVVADLRGWLDVRENGDVFVKNVGRQAVLEQVARGREMKGRGGNLMFAVVVDFGGRFSEARRRAVIERLSSELGIPPAMLAGDLVFDVPYAASAEDAARKIQAASGRLGWRTWKVWILADSFGALWWERVAAAAGWPTVAFELLNLGLRVEVTGAALDWLRSFLRDSYKERYNYSDDDIERLLEPFRQGRSVVLDGEKIGAGNLDKLGESERLFNIQA